jgi:hypothetical protein
VSLNPAALLPLRFGGAALVRAAVAAEPRQSSLTLQLLERRKTLQVATSQGTEVFHGFQFTNRIEASGILFEHQIVDDAGREYKAAHYDHGNHLFRNRGDGRFEDITRRAGLDYTGHSSSAVFFDFDNDGLLDLFLVNVGKYTEEKRGRGGYFFAKPDAFYGHLYPDRAEFSILYRNLGGARFEDVSRVMNLRDNSWSGDATFTDFNQDQLLDLFVTDMHSDMTQPQTEQAMRLNLKVEKSKSEACCSMQWTDEYLQGASNNIFGNALYQNPGNGSAFKDVSNPLGLETYWPWGISVGDLNADGFEDVFVTAGMGYPFRYGINSLLLNDAGRRIVDSEFVLGVEPRSDGRLGKVWFTLDCSGADRTNSLCAGKSGIQTVLGSLSSRSSVLVDLDEDGDLDLVTNDFNDRPQLLINNLNEVRPVRFLKIRLKGGKTNRDGLGALVRVKTGDRILTQWCDGKSGYLSQSALPLYVGLGSADRVDAVEVRWPSGHTQTLTTNLAVNSLLEIIEEQLP